MIDKRIRNNEWVKEYLEKKIQNQKLRKNFVYKIEEIKHWCNRNYIDIDDYIEKEKFTDEFLLQIICNI